MKSSNLDLKVILAILLIALVICSSCCFSIFMIKGNIAHADSTNGIVEDNLLLQNDFDIGNSSGQGWINGSKWWLGQSNSSGTFNNQTLSGSNSSGYVNIRQWCDNINRGVNLHFRVQTTAHTGNWLVQIWYYHDKNGTPSQGFTTGWFDASYREGTFQLDSSYEYAMFVIQCRNSITLDYVKLEYGSSFTGYVPKDYSNYGYNQGLEDATEDAYENFAYKGGYELLGSLDLLLNIRSEFFSNYSSTIYRNYSTNYLEYFTYKGVQYGEYKTYIFINGGSFDYSLSSQQPGTSLRPAIRIAKDVTYVGDSLWLTFDNNYNNSYCLFCVSQNGNIVVKSFDFFTSIYMNGVLASQIDGLVQGEVYDFYIGALSDVDLSLNLRSIYGGIGYYAIYSILSAYNVGEGAYARGLDVGYDNGKNDGITEGKIIGRNEAWAEAQEYYENMGDNIGYSFSDMLYAIVDSPVKVLGDMLNFDFLGFNLKAFFFSIVTIAIIILIVKRFI